MSEESSSGTITVDVGVAIRERYGRAAQALEPALCCPTSYDPRLREHLGRSEADLAALETAIAGLRLQPMIADRSVDC